MEEKTINGLKYLVRYPAGFDAQEKSPVILLLHGAGARGESTEKLRTNPFLTLTEQHEHFPFLTVAPLCSADTWFDLWEKLVSLVHEIEALPFVDPARIYLVGASMGAYATWQLAMSMPEHFAALVPVCGGGMYWNAARIAHVPVWAFHGARDTAVFPEESQKMVDAINRHGGAARLTVYPKNGHDAWTDTYANPEVFRWLLEQSNQRQADCPADAPACGG